MTYDETVTNLLFNYFLDLRKKDIDKRQRAELLNKYLEQTGKSQRELAKELGIPHSTIQDWLMISKLTKEEYDEYLEDGLTDTDIYRTLRNNKKCLEKKEFDIAVFKQEIKSAQERFRKLTKYYDKLDDDTITELKSLIDTLNHIILKTAKK